MESSAVMRVFLGVLVLATCLAVGVDTADAAAPWLIIVDGSALGEPVVLDDWNENAALMSGIATRADMALHDLEQRPYFDVALFWGPDWQSVSGDGEAINRLDAGQANQHGRFYPATPTEPAVFSLNATSSSGGGTLRWVAPGALEVLGSRGIPVQIGVSDHDERPLLGSLFVLVGLALAGSASLVFAFRR
jgi:hypothetical protein